MDAEDELAPAVESILHAARSRDALNASDAHDGRVSMDARSVRSLAHAFARAEKNGRVPLVAEVKPTSPTTEKPRTDDPVKLARQMVDGGAAALSVLTESEHFGGSPENLRRVREAVDVPVLRKDFVLREGQLDAVEADIVLLIVRFVDDLGELLAAARERGFQALVEVHTRDELTAALNAGAKIVGVNNRDLARLDVNLETFESVAPAVPGDVTLVAESGISTPEDVRRMREAGADGLLVGSAIMDGNVTENARRLVEA